MRILLLVSLEGVADCQANAEFQAKINADLDDRLEAYNGKSMTEFMGRTGMLPVDTYDISEGRGLIFRTDPVYLTLATHVTLALTRSALC